MKNHPATTPKPKRPPTLVGTGGRLHAVKLRNWKTRDDPNRNRDPKKQKARAHVR